MNKTIYIAPEVEQIKVRFEENILASGEVMVQKNGVWEIEDE